MLSRRAKAYKELIGDSEVAEEELLQLMVKEPTLLRRPLIIHNGCAVVGFDPRALMVLIGNSE